LIYGYSITREYRLLLVYKFNDGHALISIARFRPQARLDREVRWKLICSQLRSYKLPEPPYFPPATKHQPRSSEHSRERWIKEHLDEFPLGHIAESRRKLIIERMKQAGLFAPSTYWKDAWRGVERLLRNARSVNPLETKP
jgi:hypothetical protein